MGGKRARRASAAAPSAAALSATALAGAVSAAASVVTASATSLLSGAIATLTLHAKDAFGNDVTAGGRRALFSVTGGTSTGTIGPTGGHRDGPYTPPLYRRPAGPPPAVGATIGGSPATAQPPP